MPLATASWIGLATAPAWAIALHWRGLVAGARGLRLGPPRRDGTTVAVLIALVMVVVARFTASSKAVFHLTQDSICSS